MCLTGSTWVIVMNLCTRRSAAIASAAVSHTVSNVAFAQLATVLYSVLGAGTAAELVRKGLAEAAITMRGPDHTHLPAPTVQGDRARSAAGIGSPALNPRTSAIRRPTWTSTRRPIRFANGSGNGPSDLDESDGGKSFFTGD